MRRRKDLGMYVLNDDRDNPRYEYRGPSYVPPVPAGKLPRVKALLLAASVVHAALVFLMGRLNLASLRVLYVTLLWLLLVFGAGWGVIAAVSLFFWKEKMTQREHRTSWNALGAAGLLGVIAGAAAMAGVVLFVLFGGGNMRNEWSMLALLAAQAAISLVVFLYIQKNPCRAEAFYSRKEPVGQGHITKN